MKELSQKTQQNVTLKRLSAWPSCK